MVSKWFFKASDPNAALMTHLIAVMGPNLDVATARTMLDSLQGASSSLDDMNRVLGDYATAAATTISEATDVALRGTGARLDPTFAELADLLREDAAGKVVGFQIPELDRHYQRWLKRNKDKLTPAELKPETYINSTVAGKRPHVILSALLGPNRLGRTTRAPRRRQPGKWWGKFFQRPPHGRTSNPDLAEFIKNSVKLDGHIASVYTERYPQGGPTALADIVPVLEDYLKQFAADPKGDLLSWTRASDLSNFDEKAVKRLVGHQKLDERELIHRLFDAYEILEGVAESAGLTSTSDLWQIPGIHGLVQKVVSRAGHEKAYLYELEMIVEAFEQARIDGSQIILQFKIGSKEGPDMILVSSDGIARIRQAKSYESHYPLMGVGGEMVRQTGSDLSRIFAGFTQTAPGELVMDVAADSSGTTVSRSVDTTWTFEIDEKRLGARRLLNYGEDELVQQVDWLNTARQAVQDSADEINGYLLDTTRLDAPAAGDAIEKIMEGTDTLAGIHGRTLRQCIDEVVAADPDMTVQKLMLLRMIIHPKRGTIEDGLLDFLVNLNQPVQIRPEFKLAEHNLMAGTWWGPKDVGNATGSSVVLYDHLGQPI